MYLYVYCPCYDHCLSLQRAVAPIDPTDLNADMTSGAQLFKHGHKGLLTINDSSPAEKLTTVRDSYRPPKGPDVRLKGACLFLF